MRVVAHWGLAKPRPQPPQNTNSKNHFPAAGTVLAVGPHTLSVTYTPTDPSYAPITQTVPLTVTKASLTVTAASQTVAFGAPIAPYTASLAGFVNGDTAAAVTGSAALSTTPATYIWAIAADALGLGRDHSAVDDCVHGTLDLHSGAT